MQRIIPPSFVGVGAYGGGGVRADVVAGLTVWAVLVPESLAYAAIAGVPPVVGLYASVPALVLYALLGTSRHLVVAPMSATAALSFGIVGTVAGADADGGEIAALTAALALMTGAVAIMAGAMRLGFLASFISEPVLKGFIIGLALTIMVGQVPDLIGIDKGSGSFFEKSWHVLRHLDDAHPIAIAVGAASLAALLLLRRFVPGVPGSLVVALAGVGAVAALDLDGRGLEIVGTIRAGVPALGLPAVSSGQAVDLAGAAVGVMLVGFAEGLGAAKTYAARRGYDIDPNRELIGLGASNLGAGLASGMVVNGSLSKTAVNGAAGARTQVSSLTAAALALLTLLYLTGLFEQLPQATLAAIVIAAVVELVDVESLHRLWRVQAGRVASSHRLTSRADFVAATGALLGVLVFDTLPGLVIGIGLSLVLLVARTSRPNIAVLVPVGEDGTGPWVDAARNLEYEPVPGALVVRVEAPLIFTNADVVRSRVRELASKVDDLLVVVIDGRTTPTIDVTAAAMLVQLRSDLHREGAELVLAQDVGQVRDVLHAAEPVGEPPIAPTIEAALAGVTTGRPDGRGERPPTRSPDPGDP